MKILRLLGGLALTGFVAAMVLLCVLMVVELWHIGQRKPPKFIECPKCHGMGRLFADREMVNGGGK